MAKRKRQLERLASDIAPLVESTSGDSDLLDWPARKARRAGQRRPLPGVSADTDSDSESSDNGVRPRRPYRELSHIKRGKLAFPRSAYEGYQPPLPVTAEAKALEDFEVVLRQQREAANEPPDHQFVILEDFSAYRHPRDARRPNELAGLEKLQVHRGASDGLLFDGTLRVGDTTRYVQGVPFKMITVEGYGDSAVTDLSDRICVQSALGRQSDIWYQLGRPAKDYERFYQPFVWLAEFTKYFVDYLLEMAGVTLDDFRFCFHDWLVARHVGDAHFEQWLNTCRLRDFRTTVSAHVPYLWNECSGVETSLLKQRIWGEVDPCNLKAIPKQPNKEQKTVVTPFAYDMFKHMYFCDHLSARKVASQEVSRKIQETKTELGLTPFDHKQSHNVAPPTPNTQRSTPPVATSEISTGDVICLDADCEGDWKCASSIWYAFVQGMRVDEHGQGTLLDVLWLYEPHDTTLGAAHYPFENELFLSDNCACARDAINAKHVRGKVSISWFAKDPYLETGLFVRQKFRTVHDEGTDDFVSLQATDFECRCQQKHTDFEDCRMRFEIGDSVLVKSRQSKTQEARLDPAVIVDFDLDADRVVLRRLQRQHEMGNGLLLTDATYTESPRNVIRKCHIRTFDREAVTAGLPTGYDRGGAGDFYYIVDTPGVGEPSSLPPLTEGVDLGAPPAFRKLKGLGMFCGGGSFDRGLEDSGAVQFRYAVDWAERAMYTYRANSREPDKTECFLGSVNDYLGLAMKGKTASFIARPGGVDLISAGSPCPAFSALQRDRASDASLRNASMVASVVSYVDVFCPQYCILENVVNMTSGMGGSKDQNVFAQIVASFVAMGYQVQQFLMDAWSHGSPQSRSRVFIVASAPGLEPFSTPQLTHDHPRSDVQLRGLGKSSNGRSFGMRRNEYTPFQCASAAEATADLPDIADGQSRICPAFPDHCLPSEEDAESRERIASVPIRPRGMGLADAVHKRLVCGKPLEFLQRSSSMKRNLSSKSYSRVRPDALFPTVTTAQKLACSFTGRTLHWDQDRAITVMELRRAMGFLDTDVLIGSARQQVHIIGNSVDRKVSFALGLCLRDSWARSTASCIPEVLHANQFQLATPSSSTEEDAADAASDGGQVNGNNVFSDMPRAGASAVAASLEEAESRSETATVFCITRAPKSSI